MYDEDQEFKAAVVLIAFLADCIRNGVPRNIQERATKVEQYYQMADAMDRERSKRGHEYD